ncbi:MAG: serine/threonine-protein kinase [Polyangiaceae bacterium]
MRANPAQTAKATRPAWNMRAGLLPGLMVQSSTPDEASRAAARVGSTLNGKWRYDELIDVGTMAAVYAATHRSGRRSAIKILNRNWSRTPEVACAFLREEHPHTVRVLDDDVDDEGNVCVVMELLEGATLCECALAEGGRLAADRVLRILDQVLEGLIALHDAGIVHRDIKPANLFLTTEGKVKILDFGIAALRGPTSVSLPAPPLGFAMGTPGFMSPEQARGRWDWVDGQSDLWSLGATAFTLLSGQAVHPQTTLPELLAASAATPARSLSTALPGADRAIVLVVDRALKRDRADRWRDACGMRMAVRDAFWRIHGRPLSSAPPDESGAWLASQPDTTGQDDADWEDTF